MIFSLGKRNPTGTYTSLPKGYCGQIVSIGSVFVLFYYRGNRVDLSLDLISSGHYILVCPD